MTARLSHGARERNLSARDSGVTAFIVACTHWIALLPYLLDKSWSSWAVYGERQAPLEAHPPLLLSVRWFGSSR